MKNILIYFGVDKHASPFDILFAYDVGFDIVLPFSGIGEEEISSLVQDAMFSRGPQGARHTTLFFGGSNLAVVERLAQKARKIMFPPFQLSVTLDPKGAHTTSSALVAKIMGALASKGEKLEGKKAIILGGSGPVGRVSSRLLAKNGVDVTITSRKYQGKEPYRDIIEEVEKIEKKGPFKRRGDVTGVKLASPEEIISAAIDCELVISAGPSGVEMLPEGFLSKLENCMVVTDINAVAPFGIGGVKPDYDKKEVGGKLTIGAHVVGSMRNKIAAKMLKTAREAEGVFLDYINAFEFGCEFVGL